MATIHLIHENSDWLAPFADAFDREGLDWSEWFLDEGSIDLDSEPPEGVFYSRMSASSHVRGHDNAKDLTRSVLSWLESHGRTVVNGRRVIEMEMSKVDQHAALRAAGFDVPRTIAVAGRRDLAAEAHRIHTPFLAKHNQSGRGIGIRSFDHYDEFDAYIDSPLFEEPVDGITLLQEYLQPAEPFITRVEIVGHEFLYALQADTSAGFMLCPADQCDTDRPEVMSDTKGMELFRWREGFAHPIIEQYIDFTHRWDIGVVAFEFIETEAGRLVTYDINTNTNYNSVVEEQSGRSGPEAVARYLGALARQPDAALAKSAN